MQSAKLVPSVQFDNKGRADEMYNQTRPVHKFVKGRSKRIDDRRGLGYGGRHILDDAPVNLTLVTAVVRLTGGYRSDRGACEFSS